MVKYNDTICKIRRFVVVKNYKGILPVLNTRDVMLYSSNGGENNLTDSQLRNTILYYERNGLNPFKQFN